MTLSSSQRTYFTKASQAYHMQLAAIVPSNDQNGAIAYLRQHAIDFDIATRYGLGYVAEPLPGDERFAGRIAIPYHTSSGVQAINFRALGEMTPKYLKPKGQAARLYNVAAYFAAGDTIGVTEGEVDAIVATERLGVPSVGIPGAQSFAERWTHLFQDFERVVIFADGDDAGSDFADRLTDQLGWRARVVTCDPGEDVASMVAAGSGERLTQLATARVE